MCATNVWIAAEYPRKRPMFEDDPTETQLHELLPPFPHLPNNVNDLRNLLNSEPLRKLPIRDPIVNDSRVELSGGRLARDFCYAIERCEKDGNTEDMVHFWIDVLIRQTFMLVNKYTEDGPNITYERNKADSTPATKKSLRPDWMVWLDQLLVFKGEEKATNDEFYAAIEELQSKFGVMHDVFYGKMQYVICYAAAGASLGFFAMDRSGHLHVISDTFNLEKKRQRISVLCFVLNIVRLLRTISPHIPRGQPLIKLGQKFRHGSSNITILPDKVMKEVHPMELLFRYDEDHDRLEFLTKIYEHAHNCAGLAQGQVKISRNRYCVEMSTIGISLRHWPLREEIAVRRMARAILLGLQRLHTGSFVHQDVRLANILYLPTRFLGHEYALIDFEHAGEANRQWKGDWLQDWSEQTLDKGRYTTGSDIFQFGALLEREFWHKISSEEGRNFIGFLKSKPTASDALEHSWIKTLP
ncbi:hypothetical protein HK102_008338 [Quaeritorhiza haematococci]|nr:hypothetical protein HK102_008338 [Quaeritorhiza haematococci]